MPPSIRTKAESWQRFLAGDFGNKPRAWGSMEDMYASGYGGLVTVRCRTMPSFGKVAYGVTIARAEEVIADVCQKDRFHRSDFAVNEAMPDDRLLIQGEICRHWDGFLRLTWGTAPGAVSTCPDTRESRGSAAVQILRHFCDPASADWIFELLDTYDGHAVEFSAWSQRVGDLPGRNTVVWEVRKF